MGSYRFALSFRVSHPTADLAELPARLGLPASRCWKAGEPRRTPKGDLLAGTNEESYCTMLIPHSDETELPELLGSTLVLLSSQADLLQGLESSGGSFNFFVGWFSERNSGDTLGWNLLRKMARLRISLDLDIYGPHVGTEDVAELPA